MIMSVQWISKASFTQAAVFSDATKDTVVQWYQYCRNIYSVMLINLNLFFEGIDKISKNTKVVFRERKHNRYRSIKSGLKT